MRTRLRLLQFAFFLLAVGLTTGPTATAQTPVTGEIEPCTDGQAADTYPCRNVHLQSYLPIGLLGGDDGVELNDIWGWTDPQTGSRYALVGRTDGVAFVDVTTPTDPVYVGELPTHSRQSTWRDVKVYQNHAYVVSEAEKHGLQVFDLTQLRSVSNPPKTFTETAHYDRFQSAHNVVVNQASGHVYVVGISSGQDVPAWAEDDCGAELHILDVSTPDQPEFEGCHTDFSTGPNGYTHDAQCVTYEGPDADYQGREICFSANKNQLNVADVTDASATETITNATYPKARYVHQAWLTEDQKYLLVDDELDEQEANNGIDSTRTLIFDVSDLDNPEFVKSFTGETTSIDHNQYVVGNYSYQANYTAGLRILDVSNPEAPGEAAYFDTYPASNATSFSGAWSLYPFFKNGIVVVSSIGEGLFVLQPTVSPIINLRAEVQGRTSTVRWRISSAVETKRVVLERRPPEIRKWMVERTFDGKQKSDLNSFTYKATRLQPGTHEFRVRHVSTSGEEAVSNPVRARVLPDDSFTLTGLPNPIQGQQAFSLILRKERDVHVGLYDTVGRRVATLYDGVIEPGTRTNLTLAPPSSGVYFLRVQGKTAQMMRKVVVVH